MCRLVRRCDQEVAWANSPIGSPIGGFDKLLRSVRACCGLEILSFPIDEYTRRPLVLKGALAVAPDVPGRALSSTGTSWHRTSLPVSPRVLDSALSTRPASAQT